MRFITAVAAAPALLVPVVQAGLWGDATLTFLEEGETPWAVTLDDSNKLVVDGSNNTEATKGLFAYQAETQQLMTKDQGLYAHGGEDGLEDVTFSADSESSTVLYLQWVEDNGAYYLGGDSAADDLQVWKAMNVGSGQSPIQGIGKPSPGYGKIRIDSPVISSWTDSPTPTPTP